MLVREDTVPAFKFIGNTGLTVDAFRYRNSSIKAYFLSHAHADHYQGLSDLWDKPFYCGEVTGRLVHHILGVRKEFIRPMAMNTRYVVEGVEVFLVDANHCPGACQLLFRQGGRKWVHCGDMRFAAHLREDALLREWVGATAMYLDTTYCNPRHTFPLQAEVVEHVASTVHSLLAQAEPGQRRLILVQTYCIGKERILLEACQRCGIKAFVTERKMGTMRCLDWPGTRVEDVFTQDPRSTPLHVVSWGTLGENFPFFKPNYDRMTKYAEDMQADEVIGFVPTGWTYENKKRLYPVRSKGMCHIHLVPYSEHSSFTELQEYVGFIKPFKIIPTVGAEGPDAAKNVQKMQARFRNLVDNQAQKASFLASFHKAAQKQGWAPAPEQQQQQQQQLPRSSSGAIANGDASTEEDRGGEEGGSVGLGVAEEGEQIRGEQLRGAAPPEGHLRLPQGTGDLQPAWSEAQEELAATPRAGAGAPSQPGSGPACSNGVALVEDPAATVKQEEKGLLNSVSSAAPPKGMEVKQEGVKQEGAAGAVKQEEEEAAGEVVGRQEAGGSAGGTAVKKAGGEEAGGGVGGSSSSSAVQEEAVEQLRGVLGTSLSRERAERLLSKAGGIVERAVALHFDPLTTFPSGSRPPGAGKGPELAVRPKKGAKKAAALPAKGKRGAAAAPSQPASKRAKAGSGSQPSVAAFFGAGGNRNPATGKGQGQQPQSKPPTAGRGGSAAAASPALSPSSVKTGEAGVQSSAEARSQPGSGGVSPVVKTEPHTVTSSPQAVLVNGKEGGVAAGAAAGQSGKAAPSGENGDRREGAAAPKPSPPRARLVIPSMPRKLATNALIELQAKRLAKGEAAKRKAAGEGDVGGVTPMDLMPEIPSGLGGKGEAPGGGEEDEQEPLLMPAALYDPEKHAGWGRGRPVPYLHLARAFRALEGTSKRLKKDDVMVNAFRGALALTPEDLLPLAYLLCGKLAPEHAGVELSIGGSTVGAAVMEVTGISRDRLRALYDKHGDMGDVAQAARSTQTMLSQPAPLTVRGVFKAMHAIVGHKGPGCAKRKQQVVLQLLRSCRDCETQYLTRALVQNLRVGANWRSVIAALARAVTIHREGVATSKARLDAAATAAGEAFHVCPSLDLLVPALLEHGAEGLQAHLPLTPGVPLKPMLAKITEGVPDALRQLATQAFLAEHKYDGTRAQIHLHTSGEVDIFSRNCEDRTKSFPDVCQAIRAVAEGGCRELVLDCELVAVDRAAGNRLRSFQELSTRRRGDIASSEVKVDVCCFVFDLLYVDGEPLLHETFRERRRRMYGALPNLRTGYVQIAQSWEIPLERPLEEGMGDEEGPEGAAPAGEPAANGDKAGGSSSATVASWREARVRELLGQALGQATEGLMLKGLDAACTYQPSKRSQAWLKIKRDYCEELRDSLDLVPIGAWRGQGRKVRFFSPFLLAAYDPESETFQSVCRCMSGFTDAFYHEATERLAARACARKPYYDTNEQCAIWFEPSEVWELRGADLTLSAVHRSAAGRLHPDRGVSVRFPRFVRTRPDKTPEEATGPDVIVDLYNAQTRKAPTKCADVEAGSGARAPATHERASDDELGEGDDALGAEADME